MKTTDDQHTAPANDDATRLAPITGGHAAAPPATATATDNDDDDATVVKRPSLSASPHDTERSPWPLDTEPRHTTSQSTSAGTTSWAALSTAPSQGQVGVGTLLKGRFLLEREIGRGGMGVVYLARDERKVEARDRNPHIAVKVLNDDFRRHPDALMALQREARKAQSLAHDNIVRVYDFDKDGTIVFMTMEYIHGTDLRELIRGRQGQGVPLAGAIGLIEGMGRALERAHKAGVVHSDFKPGNVMVGAGGLAKVFDFGIARATRRAGEADDDRTVFDATTLGAMTPAYASLGMLRGEEPSAADDVYAFGCVVYELLAGRHPFDKLTAEQAKARGAHPKAVRGLSRRQNRALQRCLAFDAADRPPMAEVLAQLRPLTVRERVRPYALTGVLVLLGGALGASWLQGHLRQRQAERILARLSPTAADRFADENQASQALMALEEDDRQRLIANGNTAIESFLLGRIDHYWMPDRGREDYAGSQRVLALRDRLKLFSPRLETRRTELEQERIRVLNQLDTLLSQAIAKGALFENQPDNAVAILDRVRKIDPNSRLLHHAQLALSYDHAIAQAIAQGQLDSARTSLATARRVFPADPAWPLREKEIAATASVPRQTETFALADPYAAASASQAPAPVAPVAPVDDSAMKNAEIEARIDSLRGAVAARDADKVADLLQRIAELAPEHPFLRTEGPRLLRDTVLGQARILFRQGKWADATDLALKRGDWNGDPAVRQASQRYALAADLARQSAAQPPPDEWQQLQARVQKLRAQDAKGMRQLQADMAASNRRSAVAATALLTRLSSATAPNAAADKNDAPRPAGEACRASAAGMARPCSDSLGSRGEGPSLIVIPRAGQKPLAIMRKEISIEDLKPFCAATQACPDSNRWRNKTVASDVPLSLIQQYAQWLGQASGKTYRLPTDAEWLAAARAGGVDSVCEVAVANRWGLLNMAGGVGEWVVDGGAIGVRGTYAGKPACTATGKNASDGRADNKIGARLVRELK